MRPSPARSTGRGNTEPDAAIPSAPAADSPPADTGAVASATPDGTLKRELQHASEPPPTQARSASEGAAPAAAPYAPEYKIPPPSNGKSTPLPANAFVVSLVEDQSGRIWAGTEDLGVFRFDPAEPDGSRWSQFTAADGLGDDNAYAICVDRLNRIWVGHLNHGVSVYNGVSWMNYDVPDGPIGERIFSIAADPKFGDVWIATSAGLTRYSLDTDKWTDYTRDDGLPSDQIQSLAFDATARSTPARSATAWRSPALEFRL